MASIPRVRSFANARPFEWTSRHLWTPCKDHAIAWHLNLWNKPPSGSEPRSTCSTSQRRMRRSRRSFQYIQLGQMDLFRRGVHPKDADFPSYFRNYSPLIFEKNYIYPAKVFDDIRFSHLPQEAIFLCLSQNLQISSLFSQNLQIPLFLPRLYISPYFQKKLRFFGFISVFSFFFSLLLPWCIYASWFTHTERLLDAYKFFESRGKCIISSEIGE